MRKTKTKSNYEPSWSRSQASAQVYGLEMRLGLESQSSDSKYYTVHNFTIVYRQNHTKQYSLQPRQKRKLQVIVITWASYMLS